MDQQNQNNTPDGSGDVPMKRKRGRPRKYPRPDSEESSYGVLSQGKKQIPVRVEQAPVPPGFGGVNGNQHIQRVQENDLNDAIVGQVVSGVIEAVFDAGYLLSVRVGDSDTTLRGLVFKPGRFVPVSPENDVAPGVPMIQRNEVPFPSRTTQFQTPAPKEKIGQPVSACRIETLAMNGSSSVPQFPRAAVSSSNLVTSSGNSVPSVAVLTTDQLARSNVVPVLLTPNNFSNGMPVSNQPSQVTPVSYQPSLVTPISSQPSQVTPVSTVSGVIVSKEIPVDGNQALTSNAKTIQISLPSGAQSEGIPQNQPSSDALNGKDPKPLAVPSAPFEQLVTEVVKRIETPLVPMNTETGNSKIDDNISVKDPSTMQEDKVNDMDQGVLIQPLQAVQSHPQEDSSSAPKASDHPEIGKMTELLQVLQNDKTENQASKAAELESGNKLDEVKNFGTGL